MEFTGRVTKVLPMRSGTSQRTGNQWQALPFVFEYFEHDVDRYADSVLLETFDANVIPHLKEGMEVRCGFSHKVRTYQKDGKDITINDIRLYKIESVKRAAQQPANGTAQSAQVNNQTTNAGAENCAGGGEDDLPF